MKFMMNGAVTIGTLDGANVEIREQVGPENFFLFGLGVEDVKRVRAEGYRPMEVVQNNPELAAVIELIQSGVFSHGDRDLFQPLIDNLLHADPYLVLADFADYCACQERVGAAFQDTNRWTRMSILNSARSGLFSSDRTIREYCDRIWHVDPVHIRLANETEINPNSVRLTL